MSKFFTYEERLTLQKFLKETLSFKEISRRMDKNPTTISREVRKYSSQITSGYPGFPYNACKDRMNCRKKDICGKSCKRNSSPYCKLCPYCNENCSDFIEEICTAQYRVPYVCNGCETVKYLPLLLFIASYNIFNYIIPILFLFTNQKSLSINQLTITDTLHCFFVA